MYLSNQIAVIVFIACFAPLTAHSQSPLTLQACIKRASTDNALYPQRIDKGTTVTGVSCRESASRVIYAYDNKLDALRSELAPNAMTRQADAIRTMLCTNSQLTALLKLVDMEYVFYDAANAHVGTITNRIEDCRKTTSAPKLSPLPFGANAGNWIVISKREDGGGVLQVDQESLVRKGSTVRVWTKAAYREAISINAPLGPYSRAVLALNEIDCAERTETVRRIVYLADDGQPIPLSDIGPLPTTDIVPDTPKEKLLRFVCSSSLPK